MAHKYKKFFSSNKRYLPALLVILLVVLMTTLELTNTTHLFHTQKVITGTIPTTSANNKPSASSSSNTPAVKGEGSTPASQNTSTTNVTLLAPWGLFVSTHSRGLSASMSNEVSACNTSAGASCYIEFKQGDITKTLASQTADGNGIVSWSWDVATAGLTVGQWQIYATATLGGQAKTTQDPRALDIQP